MEVLGWPSLLTAATGSATGDSRVTDVTPAPYASLPRVLESPPPALWQAVPVRHRPSSPFAVTLAPACGQQPAAPRGRRHQKTPKSTWPGAIFGDPDGAILCPKVPSPHWGHSHPGGHRGKHHPKSFHEGCGGLGHWWGSGSGTERVPPACIPLLASISGCGGEVQHSGQSRGGKRSGLISSPESFSSLCEKTGFSPQN